MIRLGSKASEATKKKMSLIHKDPIKSKKQLNALEKYGWHGGSSIRTNHYKNCPICKKLFWAPQSRNIYCSVKCRHNDKELKYQSNLKTIETKRNNGTFKKHSENMRNGRASKMGKLSRIYENEVAKTLKYDKVFLPNEICDRVCVKNGQIFFVEIKHPNEKLRPKQEEFKNIVKEFYKIEFGK